MELDNLARVFCLLLTGSILSCTAQTTLRSFNSTEIPLAGLLPGTCRFAPGLTAGNEVRVLECCNQTVVNYTLEWNIGRRYLTSYLQSLYSWKCPQFEDECRERIYEVNEFTGLVYDYFCNYDNLVDKCIDVVNATISDRPNGGGDLTQGRFENNKTANGTQIVEWRAMLQRLDSNTLSLDKILLPCVQVAFYDAEGEHFGDYHEVIQMTLPSCQPTWCGVDGDTLRSRIITAWTCMPSRCRTNVIVIMVVCGLLAFLITLVNLAVILVYAFNPTLLHSQGIYKISLALADILVGIIVFPTFIGSVLRFTSGRHVHAEYIDVIGYATNESDNATTVQVRNPGGQFTDFFDQTYLNAVGFFTVLSLSVSVYSLTVAGFDRLTAVYRPLRYHKDRAKEIAKKLSVALWCLGFLFAILPTFVPGLQYVLIASLLVSSGGQGALILYLVAFAIPLLLMWIVNGLTFHYTKMHSRARRHLTFDSKKKTISIEIRLARTLSIMVGIFTISILPAALVILASFFSRSIYFSIPQELNLQSAIVYLAFEFVSIIILACNSLWNFFIYSARNLEFRKAFLALIGKTGMDKCCSRLASCAQSVVHDGRRRFSSIPSISTGFGKKSSLIPTSTTNITSKNKSSSFTSADDISQSKQSHSSGVALLSTTNSSTNLESASQHSTSSVGSVQKQEKNDKKKKAKNHNGKNAEEASDDSVFQSFAIDANADRLCLSVMEKIDEEIVELRDDNKK